MMAGLECSKSCWATWLKNNSLLLLTLVGVVIGFLLAFIIKPFDPSLDAILWIGLPGELFIRGLKCSVIPVVVSTVISAVGTLDVRTNGRLGLIGMAYIMSMTFLSPVVGVILTLLIKPGASFGELSEEFDPTYYETQDVFADLLRNIIPDNIVLACLKTIHTDYELNITRNFINTTNTTTTTTQVLDKSSAYGGGTNMLGILAFCIAFGIAMSIDRESSRILVDFFTAVKKVIFKMLTAFIWTLPIGTASLIAKAILLVDDVGAVFEALGMFAATVITGLCIHVFITLSLVYFITTRRNPFRWFVGVVRCVIMAMVIKSSAATMPEIFRCCEENMKVRKQVSSFCIPLCVAFKGDGSALFIASSSLWLAQTANIVPTAGQVITITILSWTMSMCLPSVPSSSLVAIATVVSSTGIPIDNIAILVAMEWLLDSLRTGVNVTSHTICTGIADARIGTLDNTYVAVHSDTDYSSDVNSPPNTDSDDDNKRIDHADDTNHFTVEGSIELPTINT